MRLGLGIRNRLVKIGRTFARRRRQQPRRPSAITEVRRLHIGCGRVALPGWVNVDREALPGVEFVLDVREGLPFRGAEYVYAEHFLEHLSHDEGIRFLAECREVLAPSGVLRLSTPNLDWTMTTHYHAGSPDPIGECFAINKAFRGWGHQFLYNEATLHAALLDAGFATIRTCAYGESEIEALRGLEHHERDPDSRELPHVLVVEASGRGSRRRILEPFSEEYDWAVHP